jgi:hypothetical protein
MAWIESVAGKAQFARGYRMTRIMLIAAGLLGAVTFACCGQLGTR